MSEEGDSTDTHFSRWWRRAAHRLAGGPRSREDLLDFLKEARESEIMDADALAMFLGVLGTDELQVRDIMVPRSQMVVVERDWTLDQLLPVVVESGHSRFPVIGDSRDEVLGILLAKDLLRFSPSIPGFDASAFDLMRDLRPASFVPESKRVNILLKDFKRGRSHMAIVVDEYGGVAGLVTIEDVLEQIVGEIDDEYDDAEAAPILKQDDRRYLVNGLATVEEFNQYFGTTLPTEDFDTVGGLVMHRFGHMPKRGESVRIDRFNFNVQRADSRRVQQLQVTLSSE
ncbi:magnesium and cobalt transporter [Hydrocarboniphaga daqingensis]|jgi:magnesium and cobalt transporter|uniref:Magnesium and cobalt efflux protein CorC n=1 Tax=Hydrocarboniphaga daqingensis TaxID=490188 RepID=A0A1M5N8E5_9GAMM|nr:transporter associated domain-containing protein [Hydrocarboniphaga daqingensis]SHG85768.1 magnesium and cobalt transporter [Hydrocarboniphaga daqingensis]